MKTIEEYPVDAPEKHVSRFTAWVRELIAQWRDRR